MRLLKLDNLEERTNKRIAQLINTGIEYKLDLATIFG